MEERLNMFHYENTGGDNYRVSVWSEFGWIRFDAVCQNPDDLEAIVSSRTEPKDAPYE